MEGSDMSTNSRSKTSKSKKAKTAKKKTTKKAAKKAAKKTAKKASKKSTKKSASSKRQKGGKPPSKHNSKAPAKKTKALRKDPDLEIDQEVLAFITALDEYKKKNNRLFPSNSEILQVLKDLGYRKA
jgi:hypothetical protein